VLHIFLMLKLNYESRFILHFGSPLDQDECAPSAFFAGFAPKSSSRFLACSRRSCVVYRGAMGAFTRPPLTSGIGPICCAGSPKLSTNLPESSHGSIDFTGAKYVTA